MNNLKKEGLELILNSDSIIEEVGHEAYLEELGEVKEGLKKEMNEIEKILKENDILNKGFVEKEPKCYEEGCKYLDSTCPRDIPFCTSPDFNHSSNEKFEEFMIWERDFECPFFKPKQSKKDLGV
jgi:hypothetical protein